MSPEVITVSPATTIGEARELLRARNIHHLIVAEKKRVVGALSLTDLIKPASDRKVSEVMRRNPSCVERSATIREAASLMSGSRLGCIPVVADGALCGIITTADLLRAIAR